MDAVKVLSYLLVAVLLLNSAGQFMMAVLNPEAYCFGAKLSGWPAAYYLLVNGVVGLTFTYLLLGKMAIGVIASVLYFGYNSMEVIITNFMLLDRFSLPLLPIFGLVLSLLNLLMCFSRSREKSFLW